MRGLLRCNFPELLRWKSEVEASWDPGQDNSLVSRDNYMIMQGAQCMCVRMRRVAAVVTGPARSI